MISDKAYLFLKFRSTGRSTLFFSIQITGQNVLAAPASNPLNAGINPLNQLVYTIDYLVSNDTTVGDPNMIEGQVDMETLRYYDPTKFQVIEVKFWDRDQNGNLRLKGKGTTTQEDADASDDN